MAHYHKRWFRQTLTAVHLPFGLLLRLEPMAALAFPISSPLLSPFLSSIIMNGGAFYALFLFLRDLAVSYE